MSSGGDSFGHTAAGSAPERSLDAAGLNLLAVFDLDGPLPAALADLRERRDPGRRFRRLMLVGNGGTAMWDVVVASGLHGSDPIDDFSVRAVTTWLDRAHPGSRHAILYPGEAPIGLQALGALAGWHHRSPLGIGINARWGTWFAYRVALLTDADLPPTDSFPALSPCRTCGPQPCLAACPAGALGSGGIDLGRCGRERLRPGSRCAESCPARLACPVGSAHRYSNAQLRHSYSRSLQMLAAEALAATESEARAG